jgi:hypothetical protein
MKLGELAKRYNMTTEALTVLEALKDLIKRRWWFPHGQPWMKSVRVSDLEELIATTQSAAAQPKGEKE